MTRMRSFAHFILAVLVISLSFYGCALGPQAIPTKPTPDVNRILKSLEQRKNDLKTFKGVGRCKTIGHNGVQTFRIVWMGSQPQNLRVETLGPWGQSTLTFVINGSRFFLYSRQDNRYFKGEATVGNLSRYVSMPMRAEDLFGLLSGQPPILPFDYTKIRASTPEGGWLLSLYKKWGRLIEKIWLKNDAKAVDQVEVFDGWGNLQYTVSFSEFHQTDSFLLPHRIAISDTGGQLWSLTVEKFWTKVSIPDGAYTLEVPGAEIVD